MFRKSSARTFSLNVVSTSRNLTDRLQDQAGNRIPFTLSAFNFMIESVRLHVMPIASAQLLLALPLTVAMAVLDLGASWLARQRHRAPTVPPVSPRWLAQHEVESTKRGDHLDRP
jgi:hypothetical protein